MRRNPSGSENPRSDATPLGGALPLEWKLPLLVTGFLAAGLVLMLGFTQTTLVSRAQAIVHDRLTHASAQIANSAAASLARRAALLRETTADPAVRRALQAADGASADAAGARELRDALERAAAYDPGFPAELWDARGRRLAFVGPDLPAAERGVLPPLGEATDGDPDAARFGPLHAAGGSVRFWAAAPVREGGRVLGWVAQPGKVGGPPGASIRELLREDVTLYTRNADGSFWAEAPGVPARAPTGRDSTDEGTWAVRPGAGRFLTAEAPVAGTPWVMVLESPESWIARRPWPTLRRLAGLGLAIAAVGAALAWVAGRRLTRPLAALTQAAEALAAGRYDRPIVGAGRDEIGRLAAAFDAMARQVAAARAELEGRVAEAQRARAEAEHARAEAEHASRAKTDFLAVMSHELRTPLNAIAGYVQLLEMGLHGPVTEAQKDALARIGRNQAHLLALINDVLDFARMGAGQVRYALENVALHDVLAGLEEVVAPQVRAAGLAFRCAPCDPSVVVRADRDKARQVLLNLLGNALKYTPSGGRVVVECEADERVARVHVRDTGTGIRPERLPFIFEPFVQGERALNRPDEGVGLGLAISRDLARGMGGELSVESEAGRGSTFTLTLPRAGVSPALPGVPRLDPDASAARALA